MGALFTERLLTLRTDQPLCSPAPSNLSGSSQRKRGGVVSLPRFIRRMLGHLRRFDVHNVTRITEGEAPTMARGHLARLQLPSGPLLIRRVAPISSTRWEHKIAD